MPSVSATIWACIVRVPCPISVEATRIRAPRSVSSSDAFEASLTSPPPVKPEPWKNRAIPMPRLLPESSRRRRLKSVRRTASRSTATALQSRPSFWPVAVVSPGREALNSRRRAEAAERAVGRSVVHRHASANAHGGAAVGAGRVQDPARENDGGEGGVSAAVQQHVDVHGGQPAVFRYAGPMPDDAGMPLGRGEHVLVAVVDHLDRPTGLQGEQAGVPGDHRGVLFLAAEAAPRLRLDDADLLGRKAEQHAERLVDVIRALERAVDRHAAVLRHGDGAVGLDIELLLEADTVLAFDDEVRLPESVFELPLLDRDLLESLRRRGGVIDRLGGPVFDRDPRGGELLLVLVREQQDRFRGVAHLALGQARVLLLASGGHTQ